jgi:ABC-2 type transport system ATP-binding protein
MVPAGIEHLPGVHDVVVDGRRVTASVESQGLSPLMASLGSGGLTSLTTAPPTLEEIFLRHYQQALPEPPAGGTADGSREPHRRHLGRRGKESA